MTLITNSLELRLSESFCHCETAQQLWQAIEKQFSNKESHSQIYHLKQEITKIVQNSQDVPELAGHVRAKYEEIKLYRPPITDLNVLQEREETDCVYTFLAAIDSSYEAVRAQILLSIEKLRYDDVVARVWDESTRRVAMGTSDSNPKPEANAFSAQHFNPNRNKVKGEGERCSHYKKEGHSQEKCWVLHLHLRPKRGEQNQAKATKRRGT